ncbi:DNA damage-binding protein 2 [Chelonia mydas]|uniref:DNA damage-binding protein 2 n=1 Tax=Chelonia mydas TaxID=8469 RepID=M7BUW1_CHEMY|nr:DNA damage-binding protein 2 [Chelonia mydas]
MTPENQSKDKKHVRVHEHQPEEDAKSTGKRKRDHGELENEPQAKRLFLRKAAKPSGKIGWAEGGSMFRNSGVLFHQVERQCSIIHYIYQNMLGGSIRAQLRQCLQLPFVRSLTSYRLFRTASPFDRRVTCLEWHPTHPSTVAVGSKGGDIILWDYEVLNKTCFIKGMGAGGAITGMKFNPFNPSQLYTSSIAGTTTLQDFTGSTLRVFTSTEDWEALMLLQSMHWGSINGSSEDPLNRQQCVLQYAIGNKRSKKGPGDSLGGMKFSPFEAVKLYVASGDGTLSLQHLEGKAAQVISRTPGCGHEYHDVCFWYCSVDVSASCRTVVTGDNVGNVVLLSTGGEEIWKLKLHKKKVTHVEFNSRCDWLLATASVDQTVKIWDLRNIKDKSSFLHVLPHDKPVNAAYFSPTDGAKLLTTDQHSEIRVYSSSDWTKPQHLIPHPHRQFQHLTPIKATWHPRYDLIVAGRYPDPKFPGYTVDELRTVDIFDGNTGEMVCQLHDPNASGIISLNKFNPMGDTLASGMGFNILIWSREEMVTKKQEHLLKAMTEQGSGSRSLSRHGLQKQSNPRASKLKTKFLALELEGTKTKGKDPKSQGRKRKDLED